MLGGDRRRIELAYSLMFTLPGTPVIRYGDELVWEMIFSFQSARAAEHRCNGRPNRTVALLRTQSRQCRSSTKDPIAISMSMQQHNDAIRIHFSIGPNGLFECARKCRKLAGVISRS